MARSYRLRVFLSLAVMGLGSIVALFLFEQPMLALLTLPVLLVTAWYGARWLTTPVQELTAHLERLNGGELKGRLLLTDDADWERLAQGVNQLTDQLQSVTETLEQQVTDRTAALERKANQLRAVGEVGRQVAAVLETDHLLHFVARVVRGTFGYDAVAVLQRRGDELELSALAVRGRTDAETGGLIPMDHAWPVAATILSGRPERYPMDGASKPTPLDPDLPAASELAVPISLGGRVLGALAAQSRWPNAFADDDLFTLQTLAGQLAVALENGRLLEAERQLRDFAITEERNRMAREIHDTLAQGFMGILMQVRAAEQVLEHPDDVRFHLDQAQALATANLQEARRSVWNLRPRPLEGRTLGEALAEEVAMVGHRAAFDAQFQQQGDPLPLPPAVEVVLLRCAQEALNNAVKHSHATTVTVRLHYGRGHIGLTIQDNGRGFDPASLPAPQPGAGGFGLHAMSDRARTVGGNATAQSLPGAGTTVTISLPVGGVST